ncbi:MAG: ABC transporter ATP-binding protein [Candidatus Nanopelagicales bacterium]
MGVRFEHVSFTYPDAAAPTLQDVHLAVGEGEFALVVGETGVGKSTLLRLINGTVPHLTGGLLAGDVVVRGHSIRDTQPNGFAALVGVVPQDPVTSFVSDVVEDELAYTMERLGLSAATMRKRIEETVDVMGLESLRGQAIRTLSGGQLQRVAIASVLVAHPAILVLDEPTSALDPSSADDVLAALQRLVHDVGITVVISEHRLERVLQYADRVIAVGNNGRVRIESPRAIMANAASAPPIIELAQRLGWDPVPLTVREARASAVALRERLLDRQPPLRLVQADAEPPIRLDRATVRYGRHTALAELSLAVNRGEICVLMGRNGAGKSTLLRALAGSLVPQAGQVRVSGLDPARLSGSEVPRHIGVVPQQPGDLLLGSRVAQECREADHDGGLAPGSTRSLLALLAPEIDDDAHPRDLSEGQRLCLALAIVLASEPQVLLLDEPTRGLDYAGKARLRDILQRAAGVGAAVLVATHDVEFAAELAHTVAVIADGELVVHGTAANVLTTSPLFAPQVSKVLAPQHWLTVNEVVEAWHA